MITSTIIFMDTKGLWLTVPREGFMVEDFMAAAFTAEEFMPEGFTVEGFTPEALDMLAVVVTEVEAVTGAVVAIIEDEGWATAVS